MGVLADMMDNAAVNKHWEIPTVTWRAVSPKLFWVYALRTVIFGCVTPIILIIVQVATKISWLGYITAGLVLLAVINLAIAHRQVKNMAYAERDADLLVRKGVLWQRLTVVPYGRMQLVDVNKGPLLNMFGLANVQLHTASPGTDAVIEGLPEADAALLREHLTQRGESQHMSL